MNDLSSGLDYAVSPCARPGSRARKQRSGIRRPLCQGLCLTILLVSFIGTPAAVLATNIKNYTRSELDGWLADPWTPNRNIKTGEVLGLKDLARIRPLVPPGVD